MTPFGMKLETSRYLEAEMAKALEFSSLLGEADRIEFVRGRMANAYDAARKMEAIGIN